MGASKKDKATEELFKKIATENPALVKSLFESIKNPSTKKDKELKKLIEPVIESMLKKARTQGIYIGYYGAYFGMKDKIEKCDTKAEIVKKINETLDGAKKKVGLK